jgi:hypothetical protein
MRHADVGHATRRCDHKGVARAGHQPVLTLVIDNMLDGEDIVPGFACPVVDVFADPLA